MNVTFTITLDDASAEYQELQAILADLARDGLAETTAEQYMTNIVTNWLETRVRETYHARMQTMPVRDIQQTMGDYRTARSAVIRKE